MGIDPLSIALIGAGVAAAASAGTSAYSAYQAGEQADAIKRQTKVAEDQAKKQEEEFKAKQAADQAEKKMIAERDSARKRQEVTRRTGTRAGTILTSPLGDTSQATTATKTLLGG